MEREEQLRAAQERAEALAITRRHFFGTAATGIGGAALASLIQPQLFAALQNGGLEGIPHFAPKANA